MTLEQAFLIAQDDIQKVIDSDEELRGYRFNPVTLHRDYPRCWVFAAGSEDMANDGYAPAAVFAYVDKQDGHIWEEPEKVAYFKAMRAQQQESLAA
jgi:hypothetical protein